jgi:tetratricopeptide (TPR) repeat protein
MREGARIADASDDELLKNVLRYGLTVAYGFTGNIRAAARAAEEFFNRAPAKPHYGSEITLVPTYAMMLAWKGFVLMEQGSLAEASVWADRLLELARRIGDARTLVLGGYFSVHLALHRGEVGSSFELAREFREAAEDHGTPKLRGFARKTLGYAHLAREEWDEAIRTLESQLILSQESPTGLEMHARETALLAQAHLARGGIERARENAERALVFASERGMRTGELDARLVLARVSVAEGADADRVKDLLQTCAALVDETGAEVRRPHVHWIRAELARAHGDDPTQERELREAHRLFTEMDATGHAERVASELAASGQ